MGTTDSSDPLPEAPESGPTPGRWADRDRADRDRGLVRSPVAEVGADAFAEAYRCALAYALVRTRSKDRADELVQIAGAPEVRPPGSLPG